MNVIEKFRKYRKKKFQLGGTLSRERKIDVLKQLYHKADLFSDNEDIEPLFSSMSFNDINSDENVNWYYDYFTNNPDYIYSPLGKGPTIIGYKPLRLNTKYPMVHIWYDSNKDKGFQWTGHSSITGGAHGTKTFNDYDYNLVTNNCSNETRRMLEAVFNKEADVTGFTTPGDVRDFAIDNGGIKKDNQGRLVIIPMSQDRYDRLSNYVNQRKQRVKNYYLKKRNKFLRNVINKKQ